MTSADVYRIKKLEIRDKIDRLEEQISLTPYSKEEMLLDIIELRSELDRLESEFGGNTRNSELN